MLKYSQALEIKLNTPSYVTFTHSILEFVINPEHLSKNIINWYFTYMILFLGLVPRVCETLFTEMDKNKQPGIQYEVNMT